MEFEGAILQDVRAGQAGFSTRLRVEQGGGGAAGDEPGASEGDTVTLTYETMVDGADGGPATALQARATPETLLH